MSKLFYRDSYLMKFMIWLSNMVHIQILWILFSLIGVLIGGIFPSTYAMFAVHRKISREGEVAINRLFWEEYKSNFIKSNLLGYSLFLIFIGTIFHLKFSLNIQNSFYYISSIISLGLILITLILTLYSGAIAAYFDLGVIQIIKHGFIILISFPVHTIAVLVTALIFYWSIVRIPALVPFVSIAIFTYLISEITNHALSMLQKSI